MSKSQVSSVTTLVPEPPPHALQWAFPQPSRWVACWIGHWVLAAKRPITPVRRRTKADLNGLAVEPFVAASRDSLDLQGLRIQPLKPIPGRLPVVVAHGWRESKEAYWDVARLFADAGHQVLLMDLRGHGQSGGDTVSFGGLERHDVARVIDHAESRGWVSDRVITYGHSLGGSTMLLHAAGDDRVAGVIASCPFADIRSAIGSFHKVWAPWVNLDWAMRGVEEAAERLGIDLEEASPRRAIRSVNAPVLMTLAGNDRHLPAADHGHVIRNAASDADIRVVVSADDTHQTIARRLATSVRQPVLTFAQRCADC